MNIIDYVNNNADSFKQRSFACIDAMCLAQLSYYDFENIVPSLEEHKSSVSLKELILKSNRDTFTKGLYNGERNKRLLLAMAKSKRFSKIKCNYYINNIDGDEEKQFSAITFFIDKYIYVCIRGTDDTLVGWKEDFNMFYKSPIPAQEEGLDYLNEVLSKEKGLVIVGGHSKGGNIAVFASMYTSNNNKDRIKLIYNFDGPGFNAKIIESDIYGQIKPKIVKVLSQSSFIGALFEGKDNYLIVRSSGIWVTQHDLYSWLIKDNDFKYLKKPNRKLMAINKKFNRWVASLNRENRERFIETVYDCLSKTDSTTLETLGNNKKKVIKTLYHEFRYMDKKDRHFIMGIIKDFLKFMFSHKRK